MAAHTFIPRKHGKKLSWYRKNLYHDNSSDYDFEDMEWEWIVFNIENKYPGKITNIYQTTFIRKLQHNKRVEMLRKAVFDTLPELLPPGARECTNMIAEFLFSN